jgi:integrase
VRHHHALLHATLARAVKWGLLGTNPADRASPPASRQAQVEALVVDEVIRLINAARFIAMPSWRRRWLCALRWSDIDGGQATVRVRRSPATRGDQKCEGATKTHQHRDVAVGPSTVALLRKRRAKQEEYAKEVGTKLLANAYGLSTHADGSQTCMPDTLGRSYWRLAHQMGVRTRFHDLRHFAATPATVGDGGAPWAERAEAASLDLSGVALPRAAPPVGRRDRGVQRCQRIYQLLAKRG